MSLHKAILTVILESNKMVTLHREFSVSIAYDNTPSFTYYM